MIFTKKKMIYSSVCLILAFTLIATAPSTPYNSIIIGTPNSSIYDYEMNEVSNYSLGSSFDGKGMHIVGDYAYILGINRLLILDVSDPNNPTHVGNASVTTGLWGDVYTVGDYACIAGTSGDFTLVNISDPVNPSVLDQYSDGALAWGIYAEGNYAYLASETAGIEVMNFTDPLNTDEITDYDDPTGLPYDVQVVGDYAYVADWNGGLEILDVSDPTDLSQTAQVTNGSDQAWGIYVYGDYAYIADWALGLRIFDISNPSSPVELSNIAGQGNAEDVWVDGNYAFLVSKNVYSLRVFNVESKLNPYLAGDFSISDAGYDVEVHDNHIYVLGDTYLRILQGTEIEHSYTITSPTSSSSWEPNSTQDITWTSQGEVSATVDIELYRFDIFLQNIILDTANDGSHSWLIPLELSDSTQYQIKITDHSDSSVTAMSEYFEIKTPQERRIPGFNIGLLLTAIGISLILIISQIRKPKT